MSVSEVYKNYRAGETLLEQGRYSSALEAYKVAYKVMKGQSHPLSAMLMDGIIKAFEASAKESTTNLEREIAEGVVKVDPGYEYLLKIMPSTTIKVLRSNPVPILS